MTNEKVGPIWERGWEGHEQQQRARLANLPFSEKLRWLEEAHRLVLHLASSPPKPIRRSEDD